MTQAGGMRVNPEELRRAAALLDQSAADTARAGAQAKAAVAADNPFGISSEAAQLRSDWNAATTARSVECAALARAIHKLADDLRAAADSYEGTDAEGASDFASIGE